MNQRGASAELTQAVKAWAKAQGAALVGIASIDRFDPRPPYWDRAPKGHDPRDFLPTARSVISIAQPVLNGVVDGPAVLMDREVEMVPADIKQAYLEMHYHLMGHRVQDYMLEQIAQIVGQNLQMGGYDTVTFPTSGMHPTMTSGGGEGSLSDRQIWMGPSDKWADMYSPLRYTSGPISHRHCATRAGLGEFGYNNIVLTPEFGARQRFNTIVTEAELAPDPLISAPICLRDDCRLCLRACYMDAIALRDDPAARDYRSVEAVDKGVIFVDTPAKSFPQICNARRTRVPNAPVRGDCVRICPIPHERTNLPERLKAIVAAWKAGEDTGPKIAPR
jgi:epoxyqueuosine reductase